MENSAQSEGAVETPECPVPDCSLPVDVVLRSSDKILIGAHQTNLAQFSEGFPSPSDVNAPDGPVDLTEDGSTLMLLMKFMHQQRYPTLRAPETGIHTLLKLAEAAEKYLVYSAMNACNIRMDDPQALKGRSAEALKYAVKFNYPQLADRAARWTLPKYSIDEMVEVFGPGNESVVLAWVRFREQYIATMKPLLEGSSGCLKFRGTYTMCTEGHWDRFYDAVILGLPRTPKEFLASLIEEGEHRNPLYGISKPHQHHIETCGRNLCTKRGSNWKTEFWITLHSIKPFHTFLPSE